MKKILRIVLAVVLAAAVMPFTVGCNTQSAPNTEFDIEINYWKSGYGDAYMKEIIAEFKKDNPDYNVVFDSSSSGTVYSDTIELGGDYNTIDLYFTSVMDIDYKPYAEPLNDMLDAYAPGESKKIGDKFIPSVKAGMKSADGNYYGLSYSGGLEGLVYNADIINGVKYKVPRTTKELYDLVMDLYDDGHTPFIHYGTTGYWDRVYRVWQAQYDGTDYYYNTFLPLKEQGKDGTSKTVLKKEDGRKAAMDVLDDIIKPIYVAEGSNGFNFTDAQTLFTNGSAVMMANGSWLVNEMKSNTQATVKNLSLMKTPVISSITDNCTSIDDDAELCSLIDAIDLAGADKSAVPLTKDGVGGYDVEREDLDRLYEARNLMASNFDGHAMIIPEYSNAKEAAKEFIKFYYSDKAIKIFAKHTHTAMPVSLSSGEMDTTDWIGFEKQNLSLMGTAVHLLQEAVPYRSKLFTVGGAHPYARQPIIGSMATQGSARKGSGGIWTEMMRVFEENFTTYLQNADLTAAA